MTPPRKARLEEYVGGWSNADGDARAQQIMLTQFAKEIERQFRDIRASLVTLGAAAGGLKFSSADPTLQAGMLAHATKQGGLARAALTKDTANFVVVSVASGVATVAGPGVVTMLVADTAGNAAPAGLLFLGANGTATHVDPAGTPNVWRQVVGWQIGRADGNGRASCLFIPNTGGPA